MEPRRLWKVALLSIAALFAAATIVLSVYIDRMATGPELKPRIEQAASEFLGRPMTIGALEWRRWPSATLVGSDVRLYEDAEKTRLLVDAPVVEAHVAVLSVFKLAAGITELRFVSPRVNLRRDKDGEWNVMRIVDEISARPDEPQRKWGTLAFNWFAVAGGTVTVEDANGTFASISPLEVSGRGKLRFGRHHVHFPFELAARLARTGSNVEVKGDFGGHAKLSLAVKNAEASLAALAWPPAERWQGRVNAAVEYDQHPPERWSLHLHAAPFAVSTAAPSLELLELTADYDVPAASAKFSGAVRSTTTIIDVHGSMEKGALELDVKSPKADMTELASFAAALKPEPAAPARSKPSRKTSFPVEAPRRLRATLSADDVTYGLADFRSVRATVTRSTGPYQLEQLTFASLGGSITAKGTYLPEGGDQAVALSWQASGVGVQELFRLAGSSQAAAGIADSDGHLTTAAGGRFLPAMNGAVNVDVKDGWFSGLPGLLKVLSRLNITTLFTEVEGRHRQRVPFDEAHGAVTIVNGKVVTGRRLMLKNKTLEMAFMGTYDLPSKTVDGRIVVNFVTVTDEIIGLIPGVREILLGKEKGMIPIWLRIQGKGSDPDIDVLSAKTITAPVWNTVKHILRLPKTLFDKLKPPSKSP